MADRMSRLINTVCIELIRGSLSSATMNVLLPSIISDVYCIPNEELYGVALNGMSRVFVKFMRADFYSSIADEFQERRMSVNSAVKRKTCRLCDSYEHMAAQCPRRQGPRVPEKASEDKQLEALDVMTESEHGVEDDVRLGDVKVMDDQKQGKEDLSEVRMESNVVVEVHQEDVIEEDMCVEGSSRKRSGEASDKDDVLTPAQRPGKKAWAAVVEKEINVLAGRTCVQDGGKCIHVATVCSAPLTLSDDCSPGTFCCIKTRAREKQRNVAGDSVNTADTAVLHKERQLNDDKRQGRKKENVFKKKKIGRQVDKKRKNERKSKENIEGHRGKGKRKIKNLSRESLQYDGKEKINGETKTEKDHLLKRKKQKIKNKSRKRKHNDEKEKKGKNINSRIVQSPIVKKSKINMQNDEKEGKGIGKKSREGPHRRVKGRKEGTVSWKSQERDGDRRERDKPKVNKSELRNTNSKRKGEKKRENNKHREGKDIMNKNKSLIKKKHNRKADNQVEKEKRKNNFYDKQDNRKIDKGPVNDKRHKGNDRKKIRNKGVIKMKTHRGESKRMRENLRKKVRGSKENDECSPKKKCEVEKGTCKKKCLDGEREVYKGCKGKRCKCCVHSECIRKEKCRKKNGVCKMKCEPGERQINKGCDGEHCVCCAPHLEGCVTKKKCRKENGTCKSKCASGETQLHEGCVGKDCVCCAPLVE
ncbi:axoneme-associated protein mst101(2)-like, partial [Cherax quadricarinatus]|uniref:axoneme-associated protein mst101(2)-like n=1 Tax=Cherax quadricarinatus TaxID=27406 RepID=UPI00387E3F34